MHFCINFEHYDVTNDVTLAPQIWYKTSTSNKVQDPIVEKY